MLFALLGLAACGKSKEHELYDERHATCDRIARDRETVSQASDDFGFIPNSVSGIVSCSTGYQVNGKPPCGQDGQELCRRYWQWLANDDALCNAGNCLYVCEAYSPGPPGGYVDDSQVCATRFAGGQPYFF